MLEDLKKTYKFRQMTELQINNLLEEINCYKKVLDQIKNECKHEVVFNIYDYTPRKIGNISYLFCPACRKIESIGTNNKIEDTMFNNSKIIDLTDIKIDNTEENLNIIEACFFANLDNNLGENNLKETIIYKINENKEGTRIKTKKCK